MRILSTEGVFGEDGRFGRVVLLAFVGSFLIVLSVLFFLVGGDWLPDRLCASRADYWSCEGVVPLSVVVFSRVDGLGLLIGIVLVSIAVIMALQARRNSP